MKKILAGVVAFSLMAAGPLRAFPALAERTHTKVSGDLVNVGIDPADDWSDAALNALLHALASYPQARRFRISWVMLSMLNGTNMTAVYDRRTHTVTAYSTYTEGDDNGRTSFMEHARFVHVREKDFRKIAAAHKPDTDDWTWYDELPKYGCRRHELAR